MEPHSVKRGAVKRLAILGAFPYPYPQGSQIYVTDHSRALARIGLEPLLLTYGRGVGTRPRDLEVAPSPRWSTPSRMASGPSWQKFPADAALCSTYLREHRRAPFDLALAHNAEAAMIALAARALIGVPVLYVVHTVLRHELSSYASPRWAEPLDRIGRRVDEIVAGSADGILALCDDAAEMLAPIARGPVAVIPPGLDPAPPPSEDATRDACARHGVAPGGFALYTGNLDGYQDLDLLAGAARELTRAGGGAPEIVVATHDASRARERFGAADGAGLRCVEVDDYAEMRALTFAAQSLVLTRRRRGGFPIKLLNYMEASRPIVAFERIAPGFDHRENAWLLGPHASPAELAEALLAIARHPDEAARLGAGARALLERRHGWSRLARETLAFAERVAKSA